MPISFLKPILHRVLTSRSAIMQLFSGSSGATLLVCLLSSSTIVASAVDTPSLSSTTSILASTTKTIFAISSPVVNATTLVSTARPRTYSRHGISTAPISVLSSSASSSFNTSLVAGVGLSNQAGHGTSSTSTRTKKPIVPFPLPIPGFDTVTPVILCATSFCASSTCHRASSSDQPADSSGQRASSSSQRTCPSY